MGTPTMCACRNSWKSACSFLKVSSTWPWSSNWREKHGYMGRRWNVTYNGPKQTKVGSVCERGFRMCFSYMVATQTHRHTDTQTHRHTHRHTHTYVYRKTRAVCVCVGFRKVLKPASPWAPQIRVRTLQSSRRAARKTYKNEWTKMVVLESCKKHGRAENSSRGSTIASLQEQRGHKSRKRRKQ